MNPTDRSRIDTSAPAMFQSDVKSSPVPLSLAKETADTNSTFLEKSKEIEQNSMAEEQAEHAAIHQEPKASSWWPTVKLITNAVSYTLNAIVPIPGAIKAASKCADASVKCFMQGNYQASAINAFHTASCLTMFGLEQQLKAEHPEYKDIKVATTLDKQIHKF